MRANIIEESVAKRFRLQQAPTLIARHGMISPIAFTRMRHASGVCGRTLVVPPEEAFSFLVALAPLTRGEIWINGKHGKLRDVAAGGTFCVDLAADLSAQLQPPYDFLRFYLPVTTLDQLAYDQGLRRAGGLRTIYDGSQDLVMQGLALSILPALREPGIGTALFSDALALAFHAHAMYAYGGVLGNGSSTRTGLAPWQLRRACTFLEAHLDSDPSLSDLARECGLSTSYFARAFRQATGVPPHRWLTHRRIERAKELLLQSELELAQIAVACGFVDQKSSRADLRAIGRSYPREVATIVR